MNAYASTNLVLSAQKDNGALNHVNPVMLQSAQDEFAHHSWPDTVAVHVRMGLPTGEPSRVAEGYGNLYSRRPFVCDCPGVITKNP
jgi:hypothetical protein